MLSNTIQPVRRKGKTLQRDRCKKVAFFAIFGELLLLFRFFYLESIIQVLEVVLNIKTLRGIHVTVEHTFQLYEEHYRFTFYELSFAEQVPFSSLFERYCNSK